MAINQDRNLVGQNINETSVSVYAYDLALVQDLRARFNQSPINDSEINKTVQIGATDQMFRIIGELNEDQPILPFISLQRLNWQLNLDRQRISNFYSEIGLLKD